MQIGVLWRGRAGFGVDLVDEFDLGGASSLSLEVRMVMALSVVGPVW